MTRAEWLETLEGTEAEPGDGNVEEMRRRIRREGTIADALITGLLLGAVLGAILMQLWHTL